MAHKLNTRQLLVTFLAAVYGWSQKEIGAALSISEKRVSQYLRRGALKDDEVFQGMIAAIKPPPGAVPIATGCLEALQALEREGDLTAEERARVEESALGFWRLGREFSTRLAIGSRKVPSGGYPRPQDLDSARWEAGRLLERLERQKLAWTRPAVVRLGKEFHNWAVCERVCMTSEREASRNVESAAAWASLAEDIAARIPGPEEWRNSLRGYAAAHGANVLRVSGELKAADVAFQEAKRLWRSGSDPNEVLDPGRLLDLEASLRKDQRRLDEALSLLDEAAAVGRSPERALIKKGITLEKMGEYARAVEALLRAVPLVDRQSEPRLKNTLRFNLAVNLCHVDRFEDAAELVPPMRELAAELGDEIDLIRMNWLEGRITAGLRRPWEARQLLGEARREFARREMAADAALALLEEAALLLDEGRTSEVKLLARELTAVLNSKGVHREALAALRLFQEAAEREEATADLARRLLRYLFRARYDQGLRFTS